MVRQLDIPTAFLNSEINNEIYLKVSEGLKEARGKVLKMNKGICELKGCPKCWNRKFDDFAMKDGLNRSKNNFCLCIGDQVWLVIFVDDILITGEGKEINRLVEN